MFPPWESVPGPERATAPHAEMGDLVTELYPWKVITRRAVARGTLPLWNPYALLGSPFVGDPRIGPLLPPQPSVSRAADRHRVVAGLPDPDVPRRVLHGPLRPESRRAAPRGALRRRRLRVLGLGDGPSAATASRRGPLASGGSSRRRSAASAGRRPIGRSDGGGVRASRPGRTAGVRRPRHVRRPRLLRLSSVLPPPSTRGSRRPRTLRRFLCPRRSPRAGARLGADPSDARVHRPARPRRGRSLGRQATRARSRRSSRATSERTPTRPASRFRSAPPMRGCSRCSSRRSPCDHATCRDAVFFWALLLVVLEIVYGFGPFYGAFAPRPGPAGHSQLATSRRGRPLPRGARGARPLGDLRPMRRPASLGRRVGLRCRGVRRRGRRESCGSWRRAASDSNRIPGSPSERSGDRRPPPECSSPPPFSWRSRFPAGSERRSSRRWR